MRYGISLMLIFLTMFIVSCGVNIFSPFSVKDYEEANLYESQKLLDQGRYAELLQNAEKFPPQDHVAAALGIMGFDIMIITNFFANQPSSETILISWLDGSDERYVVDLAWGLARLNRDRGNSVQKNITLSIGSLAQVMLGLMILGKVANTNAINVSDGISTEELDVLTYWLTNPIDNITNIFREVGRDREGRLYKVSTLIGNGATMFLNAYSTFVQSLGGELNLSEVSNIISSLDGNSDGEVEGSEVSNFIVTFISNLISNISNQ